MGDKNYTKPEVFKTFVSSIILLLVAFPFAARWQVKMSQDLDDSNHSSIQVFCYSWLNVCTYMPSEYDKETDIFKAFFDAGILLFPA